MDGIFKWSRRRTVACCSRREASVELGGQDRERLREHQTVDM